MAALSPPKRVTLAFVHRETGSVHKKRQFEFRNEHRALIKMWAWVLSYMEEYPPKSYRLVAYIHEGPYPEFIARKLREWNIRVIEPSGKGIEVYK
ncbi:hypothetical protein APE_0728b [Aeropyrum pernix ovoid virus 1]|uniref:Uncharacterized protein n=2 Tax=root TaxID=1 RepID=Q05E52_AERPE|nr:hypothetical protein [Aeropyrum pernix]YP_009177664.1 hypothetical protein ASQ65_gp13 [Aeropyrum pernix ovoid virus 1]BAF34749.1 hypothetical protein APE_0728b [Aeropyrum pernix ovoid virus 1] [Aeropyrum pernix K1]CCD22154.1 TPA: hypothetical protein [Aeropyrum pernix ovoid virus 1]